MKNFKPPTIEEVKEYANSIGFITLNAEKWWFFYDSKNWMVGKNKMSRWKSAVQTWFIGSPEWKIKQSIPTKLVDTKTFKEKFEENK